MYQKYSIKYIYSTSQILKLSLILCTFNITGLVIISQMSYLLVVMLELNVFQRFSIRK